MNEIIKQLADQATVVEHGVDNGFDYVTFDRKKFAELIVRECIQSIQSDMDRDTMNGTISLAKHAGMVSAKTVIKKHFGIE